MPVDFYSSFFCLDEVDRKHFEILTEEDEDFRVIIEDSAKMWRDHLRSRYPDPLRCRQMFLARSVILVAGFGIKSGAGSHLGAAFALCITDRVEQRVRELDAEEENATWN